MGLHPQDMWLFILSLDTFTAKSKRLLSETSAWHSFLCLPPPLSQMSDFVFLAICSHCAALPDRRHSGRLGPLNCKGMRHSFLKLRMFLWIFWGQFLPFSLCHVEKVLPDWHAREHGLDHLNFIHDWLQQSVYFLWWHTSVCCYCSFVRNKKH